MFLLYLCNHKIQHETTNGNDMKKILFLIASMGLLMGAISCSDDDEPRNGRSEFTVNTPMVNHVYNTVSGEVLGMSATYNKLTIDTAKHTASLELRYNDGVEKKTQINDIVAKPKRLGFYELSSPSNASFSGYVDFNEAAMRYSYTTADGIRVITTIPDVFYLKTKNTISYLDTTKTTVMDNTMYQFTMTPVNNTAIVKVMGIVHAKHNKYFNNITATSVPVTVTRDGYIISGQNIATTAYYRASMDSTGTSAGVKVTDKYPFKTFNAVVDLEKDSIVANFMIGDSAVVVATGKTYPDYTAY